MITEDRLKHILGVARRCRELATEQGMDETFCNKMFILGFLHDIGYECSDNAGHADCGASMLETLDFPFAEEIRRHGAPVPAVSQSRALRILNQADMETSPKGERITVHERLSDIAGRYGTDSPQYRNMELLCKELKSIANIEKECKK